MKRQAVKKSAVQATKRAARRQKPSKAKAQFITRAEARQPAAWHVLNRMFKGATVRDGKLADRVDARRVAALAKAIGNSR